MGLALFGTALGWSSYHQRERHARDRLAGALAVTLGVCVLLLTTTQYAFTLYAIDKLAALMG